MSRHKPALVENDFDEVDCGYCGYGNDPRVRGSGGEFQERTGVPSITGITNATTVLADLSTSIFERENLDSGACAFCGSPRWLEGGRISWGKFRPRRRRGY